jgi:hypothetical protein
VPHQQDHWGTLPVRSFFPGAKIAMNGTSDWELFSAELKNRMKKPTTRPVALVYFFLGVLVIGGLSTWTAMIDVASGGTTTTAELGASLSAYVLAITVTACGDAWLDKTMPHWLKYVLFMLAAVYWFAALNPSSQWIAGAHGRVHVGGLLLAVVPMCALWWMLNGSDTRFAIDPDPQNAAGGNPLQSIQ